MAQEQTAAVNPQAGSGEDSSGYVFQNRRYVGTKETVAYLSLIHISEPTRPY